MKKLLPALTLICLFTNARSQKKDFEGRLIYKVVTQSKTKDYDDSFFKLLFASNGETLTVSIKNGMIRQNLGLCDTWYMGEAKRIYFRFKNIDTLFYRDYSSDTSKVTDIVKSDSVSVIQGFPCKTITLKTPFSTSMYLYTDGLQYNTTYEKDNTVGNQNILIREIGTAMWLYNKTETPRASLTDSCLRVDPGTVDNALFILPTLPQKKITDGSLFHTASFRGGEKAWMRYLQTNLNSEVASRYLKIPKGEKSASARVLLTFFVATDGSISHIEVNNKSEVDSHLANEAMRVIRESPPWEAATIYGVKTKVPFTQAVNFEVRE